jgi:ClpP class serine protease
MIGDVGCNWSRLWYSRLAQRHNVKQEYVYAGENKVKLNPFEEIRPESKEWVESYIKGLHLDLTSALQANRNSHFARNNVLDCLCS